MKTHNSSLLAAAAMISGLALGAAGCFGSDPNKNSIVVTGAAGSGGGTGGGGGAAGSGAGGSPGNGPIVGSPLATFDTTIEGFALNSFDEMANLVKHNNGTLPTLDFDNGQGNPSPGSLKVGAPYSGANQYVDVQKPFGTSTPINLAGKILHVRIKVTEGTFVGGAQVYVNTTGTFVFGGTFTNLARNSNWQEFTVNVDNPMTKNAGYDPTKVVQIGVQLNTGSAGSTATAVVFNIDSFSVDPPLATPDAGTTSDGAGGDAPGGDAPASSDAPASDAPTSN